MSRQDRCGLLGQGVEVEALNLRLRRCAWLVGEAASPLISNQGQTVQRAEVLNVDAEPTKTPPHDEMAPTLRQTVRQEAMEALKILAAGRMKPGSGG